jgi:hypothetical protein
MISARLLKPFAVIGQTSNRFINLAIVILFIFFFFFVEETEVETEEEVAVATPLLVLKEALLVIMMQI